MAPALDAFGIAPIPTARSILPMVAFPTSPMVRTEGLDSLLLLSSRTTRRRVMWRMLTELVLSALRDGNSSHGIGFVLMGVPQSFVRVWVDGECVSQGGGRLRCVRCSSEPRVPGPKCRPRSPGRTRVTKHAGPSRQEQTGGRTRGKAPRENGAAEYADRIRRIDKSYLK